MKNIEIYGAGLSGLTAAINLARDGYKVTVFEKEKTLGGAKTYTPSVHATPIHFEKMKNYIGIDVEPFFSKLDIFKANIYNKNVTFKPDHIYVTERGSSKDALDYNLYKIAEEEGVNFEFSHPLTTDNIHELKEGSIIAIGQNTPISKNLKIRHIPLKHYHAVKKTNNKKNICVAFFSQKNSGYFYIASKNGLISASIGFRQSSKAKYLRDVIEKIKQTEGFEFDKWTLTPYAIFAEKIQLFKKIANKKIILAGYISGFFDPFFNFGVNSALVSGKIAAITVRSEKQGQQEFNSFTKNLRYTFLIDKLYTMLQLKNIFIPWIVKKSNIPVITNSINSIPGFTHDKCLEIVKVE